ncbi:hypothetical protein HaLaN_21926 [Haematococcus lacustris]|uniref:Uncharacterized protein n=1 Tax=Haematococcus lacustris TaxID=44745 RepID=A0A6A0A393_HAELA|nr:hypothetical protein HaLaN_21926 [Haematococcus lacustris]
MPSRHKGWARLGSTGVKSVSCGPPGRSHHIRAVAEARMCSEVWVVSFPDPAYVKRRKHSSDSNPDMWCKMARWHASHNATAHEGQRAGGERWGRCGLPCRTCCPALASTASRPRAPW